MQLLRKALLEQTAIYMAILFLARLSLSFFSLYICKYKLFHFLSNHFGRCHIFTFPGSGLCSFQKISSRKRNCWSALTTRKLVANNNRRNQWHIKQRTAALLIKIYTFLHFFRKNYFRKMSLLAGQSRLIATRAFSTTARAARQVGNIEYWY